MLESFLGHLLAGGVFCLFAGQPLTVLGCTGPVLIFEKILMDFCLSYGLNYLTTRYTVSSPDMHASTQHTQCFTMLYNNQNRHSVIISYS